ncbi:glycosyl transferase family 2 [bacterium BMS3Abin03]|nr:glycosyl transferase family 2 [bacterium BMS3Abin03]
MKKKISCVLITFNEEENLKKSLPAVSWCDEIVVVDSGSSDNTLEVCEKFNCKIFHREFDGFGPQKRFAVSKAENDWILSLDADEVISEELKNEILSELNKEKINYAGFLIPRRLYFLGRKFKHGRESKDYQLRLFNRNYGNYTKDKVHEKVIVKGEVKKLKKELLHFSYSSIHQYFEKFNSYTSRAAEELYKQGKKKSIVAIVFSLPVYFVKNYFIYVNFLNGFQGFLWALFSSLYPVVKYFKLMTLNSTQEN